MSTRTTPPKKRLKREERRALIEDAATRVIAERGYDAASLDEIAAAAGISKAVLYDHFGSKGELQAALLAQHTEALMTFVGARVAAATPSVEGFHAGVEAFFEFVEANAFAWRAIFREPPSDPTLAAACAEMYRNVTLGIAAMLRSDPEITARVEAGDPQRLEMLAEQIKNAMAGLAGWWYEHRERTRDDMVAAVMDLTWVGMERVAEGERWAASAGR
jgi:AcrR family transcriptional regulator